MDSIQIIQVAIALYLPLQGVLVKTNNLSSAIVFKFLPLVSAFTLGLIAFKVI